MRGFVAGLVLVVVLTVTILSLRPGGLRRQLRFAARRLRIALLLGGVFLVASTVLRLAFHQGWVSDYGPAAVALVLAPIFVILSRDPAVLPDPGAGRGTRG